MLEHLRQAPVGIFLVIVTVILVAPLLSRLVRLPGIVGLILAGIVIGPHGLSLLVLDDSIQLLATVGLIYLMFGAGAEIDLNQFNKIRNRSLTFGLLTFALPLSTGILIGTLLGFPVISVVLLGSILASHTLIAFPIVTRLGLARHEIVSITTGATIFTDIGALLILAVVAATASGDTSSGLVLRLIVLLLAYTALILIAVPRLGRLFFKYFSGSVVEVQFVLVVIFLSAFLAEVIGMEAIVGAFLAGLAINATIPSQSVVLGRVLFLGESFFTPVFLMSIGMLINPVAFITDARTLMMSVILVVAIFGSKFAAGWLTGLIYNYSTAARMVMGGMSLAQAAATLAATLVGVQLGLLDEAIFNGVITMILVTCVASPLIVEHFAPKLVSVSPDSEVEGITTMN